MSSRTIALTIALASTYLISNGHNSLTLPSETKGNYSVESQDNTQTFRGEKSETITQEGPSDSGESSSQGRPVVTASDPSLWEEQSHRECSPEKDAYGLDKYRCNLATLHRPGQPDQPTTAGGGPRTITVTTRQAATLIASGSGITRQPPGPKVIISKAFIVYTNPAVRYQTTTILGTSIEVEFTPTSYTWGWGDGTTTTTTETSTPYDLVRIITYLTDDAEEAQGH